MKVKFAQYGIAHAHAAGKVAVLKAFAERRPAKFKGQ